MTRHEHGAARESVLAAPQVDITAAFVKDDNAKQVAKTRRASRSR